MIVNRGLGDANTTAAQVVPTIIGAAGSIGTGVAISTGVVGANAAAGTFAASSLAIPVIGAAIAGVTLVIGMWLSSIAKHNAEKTAATKIVNEAEPYLKQNLDAYMASANHTQSEKDQALANYDGIWSQVVQACSNASLEDAGKRCIADRSSGGRWPWASYYRDPIASSSVVSDASRISSSLTNVIGGVSPLVIGAGILGLAFLFGGD